MSIACYSWSFSTVLLLDRGRLYSLNVILIHDHFLHHNHTATTDTCTSKTAMLRADYPRDPSARDCPFKPKQPFVVNIQV